MAIDRYKRRANQRGKQAPNDSQEEPSSEPSNQNTDDETNSTAVPDAVDPETPTENATDTTAAEPPEAASSDNNNTNSDSHHSQSHPKDKYFDLILTSESRRGTYECDYCHSDISQLPRIRCAVCTDFDLCLDCFIASAARPASAATGHDPRTHGYRVCDSTRYPLFPPHQGAAVGPGTLSRTASTAAMSTTSGSARDAAADATASEHDFNSQKMEEKMQVDQTVDTTPKAVTNVSSATETMESTAVGDDDGRVLTDIKSGGKEDVSTNVTRAAPATPAAPARSLSRQASSFDDMSMGPTSSSNINNVIGENFVFADPRNVWTVEEDLRLLEGIRRFGLGNWTDIADSVSGQGSVGKTPKRCMERYLDGFLGRYGTILPSLALEMYGPGEDGKDQDEGEELKETEAEPNVEILEKRSSKRRAAFLRSPSAISNASNFSSRKKFKIVATDSMEPFTNLWKDPYLPNDLVEIGQEVGRDQANKAEQLFVKTVSALEKSEDVERVRNEWEPRVGKLGGPTVLPMRVEDLATLPGSELLGFMPRRGDFDIEWENDAEQVVADMEFIPGEPVADKELKLKVLAIYNARLDEREKRKQYVLSRGLYDYRKNQLEEQKLPRDERDLVNRMRLFERFHTPDEHKMFISDLLRAKRLRKEIAKLQTYRRLGIRTLAEAEQYEVDKARRAFHVTASQQKELEASQSADEKKATSEGNATVAIEAESSSLWKQYRTTQRKGRLGVTRSASSPTNNERSNEDDKGPASDTESGREDSMEIDTEPGDDASNGVKKQSEEEAPTVAKEGPESDEFTQLPGFELLQAAEASLCRKLELTPMQYQDIKKALLIESMSKGLVDKEPAFGNKRSLVKIDVHKRGQVIDFMVTAGWIPLKASEGLA